jgi:uncharacterized protein DUF6968
MQYICHVLTERDTSPGLHWQRSSGEQRLPRLWREGRGCFEVGAANAGIAYQGRAFVHPPNPSFERTPNSYAVGRRSSQTLGAKETRVMESQSVIASRKVLAVDSGGHEAVVTIAIGVPYEVEPELWACPVLMEGMHERLVDQHGIDSWQAMQLAYQLIAQLLGYFVEQGGSLLWPESRESMLVSELVPLLRPGGQANNGA